MPSQRWQLCNALDPETETRRSYRPGPRTRVGLLGMGQRVPSPPARRSGEQYKLSQLDSHSAAGAPEKLDFWKFWDLKNHIRTVCQITFFSDTERELQLVCRKWGSFNSIDSVGLLKWQKTWWLCDELSSPSLWLIWNPANMICFAMS